MDNAHELSLAAWRQLAFEWTQTHEVWHDRTTEYFDYYFLTPLESETEAFLHSLEQLIGILKAAQEAARA
jgi:hypothetical protein